MLSLLFLLPTPHTHAASLLLPIKKKFWSAGQEITHMIYISKNVEVELGYKSGGSLQHTARILLNMYSKILGVIPRCSLGR